MDEDHCLSLCVRQESERKVARKLQLLLQDEIEKLIEDKKQREQHLKELKTAMRGREDDFIQKCKDFQATYAADQAPYFKHMDGFTPREWSHRGLEGKLEQILKEKQDLEAVVHKAQGLERYKIAEIQQVIADETAKVEALRRRLDEQNLLQLREDQIFRLQAEVAEWEEEKIQLEDALRGLQSQLTKLDGDATSILPPDSLSTDSTKDVTANGEFKEIHSRLGEKREAISTIDMKLKEILELSEAFETDMENQWACSDKEHTTDLQTRILSRNDQQRPYTASAVHFVPAGAYMANVYMPKNEPLYQPAFKPLYAQEEINLALGRYDDVSPYNNYIGDADQEKEDHYLMNFDIYGKD